MNNTKDTLNGANAANTDFLTEFFDQVKVKPLRVSLQKFSMAFDDVSEICRIEGYSDEEIGRHLCDLIKTLVSQYKHLSPLFRVENNIRAMSSFLRAKEITYSKTPHLSFLGRVTRKFHADAVDSINNLPSNTMEFLYRHGFNFSLALVPQSVYYDKKDLKIREVESFDDRTHLDESPGWFFFEQKTAIITEFYRSNSAPKDELIEFNPTTIAKGHWLYYSDTKATVRHETGHGLDHIIGLYGKSVSASAGFRAAYIKDFATCRRTPSFSEKGYHYHITSHDHDGIAELFAELWAQRHGGCGVGNVINYDFPESSLWVDKFLEGFNRVLRRDPITVKKFITSLDRI